MAGSVQDDDYAANPVPDSARVDWPMPFFASMGVATALFFMQVTSIIVLRYGSRTALIAIAYGFVVAGLVSFAVSRYAIKSGLGTNLLARQVLGFRGASLFSLIYGMNSFVYFAVEAIIMGSSLKDVLPGVPQWIVLPAVTMVMVPLVWFGLKILAKLQLATFLLYAILLTIAIIICAHHPAPGVNWLNYTPANPQPAGIGIVAAIGTMNSVVFTTGLLTADYARVIRRSHVPPAAAAFGLLYPGFCFIFAGLLGMWFSTHYGNANPGMYFVTMLGGWGTLFAFSTQLRINLSNMYTGSLAFVNLIDQVSSIQVSRHLMVFVFGAAVGTALFFDVFSDLTAALNFIGMFTTCFTCLVLADLYLVPNVPYKFEDAASSATDRAVVWRWPAVISLAVSTAGGCILQTGIFGPVWVSMASVVAALCQTALYLVWQRLRRHQERIDGMTSFAETSDMGD
jgi:purine-cytosine permease-like protein